MPRLSRLQQETRRQITDLAGRSLLPCELAEDVCRALARAVPNDGYRLFALDSTTRLINRTLTASDTDTGPRREWLREIYQSQLPSAYSDFPSILSQAFSAVAIQQDRDICWGMPKSVLEAITVRDHRNMFHQAGTPVGGAILAGFSADNRWVAFLQLYRRDQSRPFRPSELSLVQLMASTIGQSLDSAARREAAMTESDERQGSSGVLILSRDGKLLFSTPRGEALTETLKRAEFPSPERLPTVLRTTVAGFRAGKRATVDAPTRDGPVRIEVSSAGTDGSVAVILSPHRPPSLPKIPEDWSLTMQEQQVIMLLIQGMSNAEIARRLSSSERTIESHLGHIYAKLDVRGRSEVIACFFMRTYLPSLERPDNHDSRQQAYGSLLG